MSYKILTLNDPEEWNNLLAKLPVEQQDIYYTPEYYSLYENYGDGKAMCFVFEKDGDIALYPFLINSVNALGYDLDKEYYDIQGAYGYNGVVSSSYKGSFIKEFFKEFNSFCTDINIIAEFSRTNPLINNSEFFNDKYSSLFDRKTVYFDLKEEEENVFNNLQHSTKRQIRRATNRFGLELKVYNKMPSDVDDLIAVYNSTMARANAIDYLYFSKEYFYQFANLNNTLIFCAYHENKPVSVIFGMYGVCYFHGHLAGSLREYMHMSPSSFLYWEMYKYSKAMGQKYLHLGGGDDGTDDNPLLKFKMNFSKHTFDYFIAKRVHNPNIYNEVISQWQTKYPEKVEKYENHLLKYRY